MSVPSKKRKRTLSDYFRQEVGTAATDCDEVRSVTEWLRSHFPYDRSDDSEPSTLFVDLFNKLNERQLMALLKVRSGRNLFLTGSAGTGKTLWLRVAVAMCQSMQLRVAVCATTALAASNIEVLKPDELPPLEEKEKAYESNSYYGQQSKKRLYGKRKKSTQRKIFEVTPRTLHSFAGVGIEKFDPVELGRQILKGKKYLLNRWRYTDVLFIDEVSMLDPQLFVALDKLAQVVRRSNKPFGGIQLICVADFFQLPPVRKDIGSKRSESFAAGETDKHPEMAERLMSSSDSNSEKEETSSAMLYVPETPRQQPPSTLASLADAEKALLQPVCAAEARCCFQTQAWHEIMHESIVLNEVFRQNNPEFVDLLCQLRRGVLSEDNIQRLESRTRYNLTNDLLNIAHRLFGGRGCDRLRDIAVKVFCTAKEANFDLPLENGRSLLQMCDIDEECNMSQRIASTTDKKNAFVVPNWRRFERYVMQSCAQDEIDVDLSLIHMLPPECVPDSHDILVSEIQPTHIMSLNAQVDECNRRNLAAIQAPLVSLPAKIHIGLGPRHQSFGAAKDHFTSVFSKNNLTPLQLRLKIGAQVLLTANVQPPQFINGRRGVILAFMTKKEFEDADFALALALGAQPAEDDNHKYPIVEFDNGAVARVGRFRWQRQRSFSAGTKPILGILEQFPLVPGFACTIHKSQGMTIGRLSVTLTRAFQCGLPYVALSRGVNLDSIVIEEMDRSIFDGSQPKLLPPAAVLAYYDKLEREMQSAIDYQNEER